MVINEGMTNQVELLGHYGSDLTHAQSAWTSTSRDLTEDKLERVDKLLNMLASEGHETPFEKSGLHFLVTVQVLIGKKTELHTNLFGTEKQNMFENWIQNLISGRPLLCMMLI